MIGRFTHLFKKRAEKGAMRKKAEAMFSSKKEVDINGNGTSGYVVKTGPNKGKILGHRSVKSTNNWQLLSSKQKTSTGFTVSEI